jgi:protein phosphatase
VADTRLLLPPVEVAQRTDPGKDPEKQVNEDCARYGETPFGHLAVLCDGMGGHAGGLEASTAAVQAVFRYFETAAVRDDVPAPVRAREVLRDAILLANHEVFGIGTPGAPNKPGSTIVAALLHPLGTEVAHVGDSRCYLVHEGQIRQVTKDHSLVQQMVDAGQLTADQAAVHPDANRITRALGITAAVDVEVQRRSIVHAVGDTFILCSDGLSDLVEPNEIQRAVVSSPGQVAVRKLVDLANARGGYDNITVIAMQAREAAAPSADVSGDPLPQRTTQGMAAATVSASGPIVAPPASAPVLPSAGDRPLLPQAPPPRPAPARHGVSPAVVFGVLLGLVGVAAVATMIFLVVVPHKGANTVPGLSFLVALPDASLAPASSAPVTLQPTPQPDPDAAASDAGWGMRKRRNQKAR